MSVCWGQNRAPRKPLKPRISAVGTRAMRSMLSQALGVELGPIVSLQEVSGTTADLSSYSASDITGARPRLP